MYIYIYIYIIKFIYKVYIYIYHKINKVSDLYRCYQFYYLFKMALSDLEENETEK